MAFQNEINIFSYPETISKAPSELNNIIVIQRLYDVHEAWKFFDTKIEQTGGHEYLYYVKVSLLALHRELRPLLKKHDESSLIRTRVLCNIGGIDELDEATIILEQFCYKMGFTKTDNTKAYDRTSVEATNKAMLGG